VRVRVGPVLRRREGERGADFSRRVMEALRALADPVDRQRTGTPKPAAGSEAAGPRPKGD
jgi:hypothetical protein